MQNFSVWVRGNFFIPDAKKFWQKPSVQMLSLYLKENKIDAIVVATGLASLHNSELFLCSLIDPEQSILSPTPFINSVHNTISGEIALHTQNKGYSITYSQGGLSFEGALLDSILLTKEGKNVIVGGVDEAIPILDNLSVKIKSKEAFTTGSTFFNVSPNKNGSLAKIVNCIISFFNLSPINVLNNII